ncbi:MAG TPA: hypothetical protein VH349_19395 [Ktedonobacterales bacterium]|jgi:hypothetical protein
MVQNIIDFLMSNSDWLKVVGYTLIAFSFLFGGNALGRLEGVQERGGLYSTVLVAIPAGLLQGVLTYVYDRTTGMYTSHIISDLIHVPVTSLELAIFQGVTTALIVLAAPDIYRLGLRRIQEDPDQAQVGCIGGIILLVVGFILQTLLFAIGVVALGNSSGWFDTRDLPLYVYFVGGFVVTVLYGTTAVLRSRFNSMIKEVGSWTDEETKTVEEGFAAGIVFQQAKSSRLYATLLQTTTSIYSIVVGVLTIVLAVHLGANGLILLLFGALSWIVYGLVRLLRKGADNLSKRTLTTLFAVPGILGSGLLFLVNNPTVLNYLPFGK